MRGQDISSILQPGVRIQKLWEDPTACAGYMALGAKPEKLVEDVLTTPSSYREKLSWIIEALPILKQVTGLHQMILDQNNREPIYKNADFIIDIVSSQADPKDTQGKKLRHLLMEPSFLAKNQLPAFMLEDTAWISHLMQDRVKQCSGLILAAQSGDVSLLQEAKQRLHENTKEPEVSYSYLNYQALTGTLLENDAATTFIENIQSKNLEVTELFDLPAKMMDTTGLDEKVMQAILARIDTLSQRNKDQLSKDSFSDHLMSWLLKKIDQEDMQPSIYTRYYQSMIPIIENGWQGRKAVYQKTEQLIDLLRSRDADNRPINVDWPLRIALDIRKEPLEKIDFEQIARVRSYCAPGPAEVDFAVVMIQRALELDKKILRPASTAEMFSSFKPDDVVAKIGADHNTGPRQFFAQKTVKDIALIRQIIPLFDLPQEVKNRISTAADMDFLNAMSTEIIHKMLLDKMPDTLPALQNSDISHEIS